MEMECLGAWETVAGSSQKDSIMEISGGGMRYYIWHNKPSKLHQNNALWTPLIATQEVFATSSLFLL